MFMHFGNLDRKPMQKLENIEKMAPTSALPPIPAKRYFTIGEVSDLCGVKAHVLRYWEQEFTQLKSITRRGNRRYYQHHEVLFIRRIRELLYEHGFTISGARNRLDQEKNGPAGDKPLPVLIDREILKEQLLNLRSALQN
jgi:DNA-binding transcriptional MerR regulator